MKEKKNPFSFPIHIYSSSSIVGLLLHLQNYSRFETMTIKMWVKRYNNLFAQKKNQESSHFGNTNFLKAYCYTVNLEKFSSNTIFRLYTLATFYIVKFNYFSERPNKGKRKFLKYFWLTNMLVIMEIKTLLVSIK